MFHRIDSFTAAEDSCICGAGSLSVVPSELVRVFGQPTSEDFDVEGLGAYYFRGPESHIFTLYYRAYDTSPTEVRALRQTFWSLGVPVNAKIGAFRGTDVGVFKAWIAEKLL